MTTPDTSPPPGFAHFTTWCRAILPTMPEERIARRWERVSAAERAAWAAVAAQYPSKN